MAPLPGLPGQRARVVDKIHDEGRQSAHARLTACREIERRARAAHVEADRCVQNWPVARAARRVELGTPWFTLGVVLALGVAIAVVIHPLIALLGAGWLAKECLNRLRYPYRACKFCRRHPRRVRTGHRCRRRQRGIVAARRRQVTRTPARGSRKDLAERLALRAEANTAHELALLALFRAELAVPLHEAWPEAGFRPGEVIR